MDIIKPKRTYVADLDRIQGWGNNSLIIKRISTRTKTLIDVGIREVGEVREAEGIGDIVIIGTETSTLDVIRKTQSMRTAVSVDIRNGNVISPDPELVGNPLEVVEKLNRYKMNEMILLNINTVGTKSGINLDAIRKVLDVTGHRLVVAGGVQSLKEIDVLEDLGVGGVIVSTAIHEELIPVDVVR